jgi:hypothetical protein
MQLTGVKADDIVRFDLRGQMCWALVTDPDHRDPNRGKGLKVRPLLPNRALPTAFVTSRQVTGLWRVTRRSKVDV